MPDRGSKLNAWDEGYPCPDDTNGDGDCARCAHHPELRRVHDYEAKAKVQKLGVEMANAIVEWSAGQHAVAAKLGAI